MLLCESCAELSDRAEQPGKITLNINLELVWDSHTLTHTAWSLRMLQSVSNCRVS